MNFFNRIKKYLSIFLGSFFIFFFVIFLFFAQIYSTPLIDLHQPAVKYYFEQGKSTTQLVNELNQIHIIPHPQLLLLMLRFLNKDQTLRAGEYLLEPGITLNELLYKLTTGDVIQYRFTLIEGETVKQMLDNMDTLSSSLSTIQPRSLPIFKTHHFSSLEGLFFPDTYLYVKGTQANDILLRAYQKMQNTLNLLWKNRSLSLPYSTSYEALIVASLIEKETALPAERPLIAGIILNRLKLHMPLQIDSSVIYGLGTHYNNKLHKEDLHTFTPYNTYLFKGLPPTPICNPGYASLYAAFHPLITDKLYYVAKPDGSHYFSDNFNEHHQAVLKYQLGV